MPATHEDTIIDFLAEAVTGVPPARSIPEIQTQIRDIAVRLEQAADEQDWHGVSCLAARLADLALRGAYRASKVRVVDNTFVEVDG